jgi:hypothetical protein
MPLLLLTAQVPPPPLLLLLLLLLKFTLQDAAVWLDPHASLKSVENVIQQQQEVKEEAAGEAGGMFSIIEVAPFVNRYVKRSCCCCCCCCCL